MSIKILYICTHNRCRSILSEAITNHLAQNELEAYSAGSQPVGQVHPLSLRYLAESGISTTGLRSQSWDDFADQQPDIVITVCDSAASEPCPVWFGNTITLHWGLPDPSKLEGTETQVKDAFFAVMATIEERVKHLLALNLNSLTMEERKTALEQLSQT